MTASHPSTHRTGPSTQRATGVIDWTAVARASQSCCCVARPSVVIVLQPTHARPHPTEVLLCGHHFERSRATLLAGRALAFSLDGEHLPITAPRSAGAHTSALA